MNKRAIVLLPAFAFAAVALSACGGGKSRNANTTNSTATAPAAYGANQKMPNCGAAQPVWVNLNTKVYHQSGDPAYGHTRNGEYLCQSQAVAQGFRPPGGARHHRRRHHRTRMAPEAAPTSTY